MVGRQELWPFEKRVDSVSHHCVSLSHSPCDHLKDGSTSKEFASDRSPSLRRDEVWPSAVATAGKRAPIMWYYTLWGESLFF